MTGRVSFNAIVFSMPASVGLLLAVHSLYGIFNMCLLACFRHDDVYIYMLWQPTVRGHRVW